MAKIKVTHRASMNWKTPRTQSVRVSLPFVLRRQAAQLLGVRASSGRPGYTRGRATIEIAVFGVLCATEDSVPYGAFMLGGDVDPNHEKLYSCAFVTVQAGFGRMRASPVFSLAL